MKNSILRIIFFYFSCFSQPAINKNYNFKKVRSIEVLPINDFKDIVGSGKMVETSLDYNFLKYYFELSEKKNKKSILIDNSSNQILLLSCIITNYTESESIIIPYRDENRGYTETIVNQSREEDKKSNKKDIDSAVDSANSAFNDWSVSSKKFRHDVLMSIADKIEENFEALVVAESLDNGKTESLARRVDIPRASENDLQQYLQESPNPRKQVGAFLRDGYNDK